MVYKGSVDVWSETEAQGEQAHQRALVASVKPGAMTRELAMLDQGLRAADLVSGAVGATVLGLARERLLALLEDDPELGSQ